MTTPDDQPPREEPVPLFGSWRTAYWSVVVVFIVQVAFLYACTRFFS